MLTFTSFRDTAPATAQETNPAGNCVSVVGDSIAAGTLVVEIPLTGFAVIRTAPFSSILTGQFDARGLARVPVYNRSIPAANLANGSRQPYRSSGTYNALLADACDTVVMLPWNNDLKVRRADAANAYVNDLVEFVTALQGTNPNVHVIMFSHYWVSPRGFVEGFGAGITHYNFFSHYFAFMQACEAGQPLAATGAVTCIDTQSVLDGLQDWQAVVLGMQASYVNSLVAAGAVESGADLLAFWAGNNPDGSVRGDGVHLTDPAKRNLSGLAIDAMVAGPTALAASPSLQRNAAAAPVVEEDQSRNGG